MGTLNRAVTTVKKMFGFNKPIKPTEKLIDKNADFEPVHKRFRKNTLEIYQHESHPTLQERRAKRRMQGRSRNINAKKH